MLATTEISGSQRAWVCHGRNGDTHRNGTETGTPTRRSRGAEKRGRRNGDTHPSKSGEVADSAVPLPMLRISRSICPRASCEGALIAVNVTSDKRVLAVRDHGPGIPAAHLPPVTARVARVDRSRATAGNGCGLSIVTAIAKLHDGRTRTVRCRAGAARTPGSAAATGVDLTSGGRPISRPFCTC